MLREDTMSSSPEKEGRDRGTVMIERSPMIEDHLCILERLIDSFIDIKNVSQHGEREYIFEVLIGT